jgi:hypothetical protein
MSMYNNMRTRAQRARDEDALQSYLALHAQHTAAHVTDLVAQAVVVLFMCMCLSWISSVYTRTVFLLAAALLRANARAELDAQHPAFLVA